MQWNHGRCTSGISAASSRDSNKPSVAGLLAWPTISAYACPRHILSWSSWLVLTWINQTPYQEVRRLMLSRRTSPSGTPSGLWSWHRLHSWRQGHVYSHGTLRSCRILLVVCAQFILILLETCVNYISDHDTLPFYHRKYRNVHRCPYLLVQHLPQLILDHSPGISSTSQMCYTGHNYCKWKPANPCNANDLQTI